MGARKAVLRKRCGNSVSDNGQEGHQQDEEGRVCMSSASAPLLLSPSPTHQHYHAQVSLETLTPPPPLKQ